MSLKKDQTHGLEAGCFTKTSKTEIDNGRIMIFDITNYYILRMTIFMWIILFCLFLLLQCCKSSYVSKSETISFPLLDVSGPWRGCHTWGFQSRNPSSSFSLFTRRFFGWTSNQYGCHRAVFFMKRAWMWTHHRSQMLCIYIYIKMLYLVLVVPFCQVTTPWRWCPASNASQDSWLYVYGASLFRQLLPPFTGQMHHVTFYSPTCRMS